MRADSSLFAATQVPKPRMGMEAPVLRGRVDVMLRADMMNDEMSLAILSENCERCEVS